MQHVPEVTVLSAPLAHTDRRALSEAWYRALHLAAPAPRDPVAQMPHPARCAAGGSFRARSVRSEARPPKGPAAQAIRLLREPRVTDVRERRDVVTPFARRLARAVVAGARRPEPTACTIRTGGGRIVVLVRRDGARVRIVAVCTPHVRERVERALAHARFALAAAAARSEVA
jgi:hypothetical protein